MTHPWESEYQQPQFLSMGTEPLADVRDFVKWLKNQQRKNPADFSAVGAPLPDWTVLDLGCGNGKNLNYIIEHFCEHGIGYDISPTAIAAARVHAGNLSVIYDVQSIGERLPILDKSVHLVLDITASNSLSQSERSIFLSEVLRVLKPGGYFFTRALCRDGDANAKNLVKEFPGTEPDTYVLPMVGITERVFSQDDFRALYEQYFTILTMEKTTGYQKWGNQSYKRNYWLVTMQKKPV